MDGPEDIKVYEYSVLMTDLQNDLVSVFFHYHDRAYCENNFDGLKNQWDWSSYTTQDIKSSQLMSRMIVLIYHYCVQFVITKKNMYESTTQVTTTGLLGHVLDGLWFLRT